MSKRKLALTLAARQYSVMEAWPTSTNGAVWFAAPDNDGTYTKSASDEPTGDYKFWKSLGSWNGGTPQYPKLWWEE